jgi:membrane protein DedA with SNARE-associated domain
MADGSAGGWVVDFVDRIGEIGVGALIVLETVFPPIPSEVVLPLAGYRAEAGELDVVLVWLAATVGALLGALGLYALGAVVGYERIHALAGRPWFLVLSQKDLERGSRFFEHHGGKIVLLGRCVPLVRSVVSVPAGLARMPLAKFVLYTVVGSGVWNALFIGAGWFLGDNYERVEHFVAPAGYAVVAAILAWLAWSIYKNVRDRRTTAPAR